jgi:dihydrofolate reductase
MRKLVYYVAVSIDGYIAGPNGEVDFYPVADDMASWMTERYPETLPTHYRAQLGIDDLPNATIDTLIMGRGTYQPAADVGVANPYAHVRSYVVSTTQPPIDADGIETFDGDPLELVRSLKRQDGKNIWLCGGGKLAGAVLPEIDQLVIKNYPVVAGGGVPVFTGGFNPTSFTPTRQKSFSNGACVTWYDRVRSAA